MPYSKTRLVLPVLLGVIGVAVSASALSWSAAAPAAMAAEVVAVTGVQGGLAVHVGCGDGSLCAALAREGRFLVHGLTRSGDRLARATSNVRNETPRGRVSVGLLRGRTLPYADRLVRLLVCEEGADIPRTELLRVLAPLGTAFLVHGKEAEVIRKPWPGDIGEWNHFLCDADNNAVVDDSVVGPPRHVQWTAGPTWGRHHETLASVSAVVTARGRLFAIVDEAPTGRMHLPSQWRLVARDAFSGVVLWRREIATWEDELRPFRRGPFHLPRRLAAVGDSVYATLGYGKPVVALDAETGRPRMTYAATRGAEELLVTDDTLFATVVSTGDVSDQQGPAEARRALVALDTVSGQLRWDRTDSGVEQILPLSLTVSDGRVFFVAPDAVVCLDATNGRERWRQPYKTPLLGERTYWAAGWGPTVVAHTGVLLVGGNGALAAFSCENGAPLWSCPLSVGFTSPGDVFGIGDAAWSWCVDEPEEDRGELLRKLGIAWKVRDWIDDRYGYYEMRDLRTGKLRKRLRGMEGWDLGHHHRCYRNKATTRFLITGKRGMEFLDVTDRAWVSRHNWIRGMCQYGVMPGNGMIYVPPHPCRCYTREKLNGFLAVVAERRRTAPSAPFEEGPACESLASRVPRGNRQVKTGHSLVAAKPLGEDGALATPSDWPTYRHDPARSGSSTARVSPQLRTRWCSDVGGRITAPVVRADRVYVAETDAGVLHALNATDGKPVWSHAAGGGIDSPPTVHGGCVLFGSLNGWVTCLRASDGALAWRRRLAPEERLIVSSGRLESAWPVHGSLLVHQPDEQAPGVVVAAAGRSQYLDGGIRVAALDVGTGDIVTGYSGETPANTAALNDILVSDGAGLYLRGQQVLTLGAAGRSAPGGVLAADAGLLDSSNFDRVVWKYRKVHGQMLAFDHDRVYGVRGSYQFGKTYASEAPGGKALTLAKFSAKTYRSRGFPTGSLVFSVKPGGKPREGVKSPPWLFRSARPDQVKHYAWAVGVPLQIRALVRAGRLDEPDGALLLIAGWPDEARAGAEGGTSELWTMDGETGAKFAGVALDARPVFDGIAVTNLGVFVSLQNGAVVCLAE